jgi:hypothetical protein
MDCLTWFFAFFQPKTPYPPLPRFFSFKVMCVRLGEGIVAGFVALFVRFACWFCAGF